MRSLTANENIRLLFWSHVRKFAVPRSMITSATARRTSGDWAGACAAARVDVDLNLRAIARTHGRQLATQLRADLRHLAPDLLRWHYPRISPNGILRPGLTVSLARYPTPTTAFHLVARTPPAWADAGQRISLALWDPSRPRDGAGAHPHPRPDRRFRLDLHRHLWDVRRTDELWERSGAGQWQPEAQHQGLACATHRWPAEAALLLRAENRTDGTVTVRLSSRHRLLLTVNTPDKATTCDRPVLPDAATWLLPDLELLHAGAIDAEDLHPLVAQALLPDHRPTSPSRRPTGTLRHIDCRGASHRIGVVNGVLSPLDHTPDEIRREELLVAFGGPPLPCLQAIDTAQRTPDTLTDIRAHLDHGDNASAIAAVETLLGSDAHLPDGALRDELETAVRRQLDHRLYRAGLPRVGRTPPAEKTRHRNRPRLATAR
jgi:hypothetical protein